MVIMMPHIKMGHAARTDFAMQTQGLSKSKETNMSIVARTLVMTVWASSSQKSLQDTCLTIWLPRLRQKHPYKLLANRSTKAETFEKSNKLRTEAHLMCLNVDLLKIVCTLVKGLPGLANWRRLMTSSKRTWQHEALSIWEKWRGQHLYAIFRHAQIHGTTGTMPPRTASSFVSKRHTSMAFAEPRSRDAPSINSIKVISPSPLSRNLRFCFKLRNVPCEKTPTLMSTKYEPCLKIFQMFAASCNQRSQIGWANHGIPVQVGPSKISALATSCHKAQSTYLCMNCTNKVQTLTPPFGNKKLHCQFGKMLDQFGKFLQIDCAVSTGIHCLEQFFNLPGVCLNVLRGPLLSRQVILHQICCTEVKCCTTKWIDL